MRHVRWFGRWVSVVGLMALLGDSAAGATEQQRSQPLMATVTTVAPIYIGPKVQTVPLRTAAVGTRLEVLEDAGEWVQVRFGDPVLGPRVGWVQASLIRIERPELQPMDLSVPPAVPSRPSPETRPPTQDPDEPDDQPESFSEGIQRSGFVIGFSAGFGALSCEDCDWSKGLGFDVHLGGMINPRVALLYDNAATVVDLGDEVTSLDTMTFAVQVFPGSRGWIKGGAGFGFLTCADCVDAEGGVAVMGAAGAELVQGRRFAMDLQGRFTLNQFDGFRLYTVMATVGFNWY